MNVKCQGKKKIRFSFPKLDTKSDVLRCIQGSAASRAVASPAEQFAVCLAGSPTDVLN